MNENNDQLALALVGLGATVAKAIDAVEEPSACEVPTGLVVETLFALGGQLSDMDRAARLRAVRETALEAADRGGVSAEWFDGAIIQGSMKDELYRAAHRIARTASSRGIGDRALGTWLCRALAAIAPQGNAEAELRLSEAPSIIAALEAA